MDLQQYTDNLASTLKQLLRIEELVSEIQFDMPSITVPKSSIHTVLKFLKSDTQFGLSFLTTMCGVQFPDNEPNKKYSLVYQLHNMAKNERVRIKIFMSEEEMTVPTITNIWRTANWMEREAFDFYGFQFSGHPNLTRILNMDEMNYHPLRKEYALEDASRDDKADKYFGR